MKSIIKLLSKFVLGQVFVAVAVYITILVLKVNIPMLINVYTQAVIQASMKALLGT